MLNKVFKQAGWPSVVFVILAVGLWFSGLQRLPLADDISDQYFHDASTKAGIAFASTRAINATVSVIQHSELQLEPAGLGVSLALGQVLDPLNDMAERLSNLLFLSLVSLGVQKLAYHVAYELTVPLLCCLLLLMALLRCWPPLTAKPRRLVLKLVFALLFLRMMMPASAALNAAFHHHYAAPEIEAASQSLTQFNGDFSADEMSGLNVEQSFWSRAKSMQQNMSNFRQSITHIKQRADASIKALLQLAGWYVALFLLQALVLPLSVLWLLKLGWQSV